MRLAGLDHIDDYHQPPGIIQHLALHDLIQTVLFLGSYALGRGLGAGTWIGTRLSAGAMLRVVTAAAEILEAWPDGYFRLLESVRRSNGTRSGLEQEFTTFYETLRKTFSAPQFDFLRQTFGAYLQDQWDGGFLTTKNTRTNVHKSNRFLTRADAARELNVRPQTISQYTDVGQLIGFHRQMRSRRLTMIDKESVKQLKRILGNYITFDQVCCELGLSEKPVRSLIAKGIIHSMTGISTNRSRPIMYSRKEIQSLLDQIVTTPDRSLSDDELIPFRTALRRLSAIGLGVADMIDYILSGTLTIACETTGEVGFARYLFRKADIDHVIKTRTKEPKGWLTISMAAKQMNLKQQVVYELVRQGHLPSKQMAVRGQPVRMIAKQDISDFQNVYVSARTLAKKIGTSPKHLIRLLEEKGLVPDIGPRIDGNRQTFYRRSKLPRSMISLKPVKH